MDAFQNVVDLRFFGYYQKKTMINISLVSCLFYALMYNHIRVNTSGGKNNSLQNANSS